MSHFLLYIGAIIKKEMKAVKQNDFDKEAK